MGQIRINKISAEETLPIRHKVMWPDKPMEYVKLDEDKKGIHLGLKKDDKLLTVVSLFIQGDEAQFRKLATLESEQGKGYASIILKYLFDFAQTNGVKKVWCNARCNKTDFYSRLGLKETNKTFEKGGISYVIMRKNLV